MLKNMKISVSHTVSSERTCRLPACAPINQPNHSTALCTDYNYSVTI